MVFFQMPRWLRRMVRRHTHPMTEKKGMTMKTKLSILYAIIAWNGFGYVLYMCATGRRHWPVAAGIRTPEEEMVGPAIQWAHTLNIQNAQVIKVSGISKISEVEDISTIPTSTAEDK